jgi:hypothetical protein
MTEMAARSPARNPKKNIPDMRGTQAVSAVTMKIVLAASGARKNGAFIIGSRCDTSNGSLK